MAKNFVQPGNVVTVTAPSGGVSSGDGIVVGNLFGICTTDAAEGAEVELAVTGVWELPKAAGQILEGAKVWWDASPGEVVNATAAGAFPIGTAVRGVATDATTVPVRLDGISLTAAGA